MSRPKKIIIKDREFHKLWDAANEINEFNTYFNTVNDSNSIYYVNLYKYKLNDLQIYDTLKAIHDISKMSINDILKEYKLTNAALSHKFCIPIRTIEDWKSTERTGPSYIKLMMLRLLGHKILPSFIGIESWNKINETKEKENEQILATAVEQILDDDKNDDEFLAELDSMFSLKDWEQTHVTTKFDENIDTSYLDKIIHRKE